MFKRKEEENKRERKRKGYRKRIRMEQREWTVYRREGELNEGGAVRAVRGGGGRISNKQRGLTCRE